MGNVEELEKKYGHLFSELVPIGNGYAVGWCKGGRFYDGEYWYTTQDTFQFYNFCDFDMFGKTHKAWLSCGCFRKGEAIAFVKENGLEMPGFLCDPV